MPHLIIFMANYMENVPVTSGTTQSVNMRHAHINSLTNTQLTLVIKHTQKHLALDKAPR